jgi:hypothetical protein
MLTPLLDRDLKNRTAADLTTIRNTIDQIVSQITTTAAQITALRAAMAKANLYTADELGEVDAMTASAISRIKAAIGL